MAIWRINNSTSLGGEICSVHQLLHTYALGARCVCTIAYATTTARAFVYEVTTAGVSGAAQPTWPLVVGNTVVDGTVTWTCRSSSDGNWDNASCILHYISNHASPAAGDSIYIDDGHNETITFGSAYYNINGSTNFANPVKILCVDKTSDTISTGALIAPVITYPYAILLKGFLYSYGVNYKANNYNIYFYGAAAYFIFEAGTLFLLGANTYIGSYGTDTVPQTLILKNMILSLTQSAFIMLKQGNFRWDGGSVIGNDSLGVNALLQPYSSAEMAMSFYAVINNVDLSAIGHANDARSLITLYNKVYNILFERCKLPSTAGFTVTSGSWTSSLNGKIRVHHSSASNNTYDFYEETYEGVCQDESSIVKDAGFEHGTIPLSFKMISSAYTVDRINALISREIESWTDSTTSKTFTIECITDAATNLQNDEVWMELEYPVNNTDGLGAIASNQCTPLGTPADCTSSSVTWNNTGGMANPNKFNLSVTVTPGKIGPITARVYLAKASTTIYIDPVITEA